MTSDAVSVPDALECIREALIEHRRHVAAVGNGLVSEPLLLAATVGERERLQPMVRAVLKAEGGLLVDATVLSDRIDLTGTASDIADLQSEIDAVIALVNSLPDDPGLALIVTSDEVVLKGKTAFSSASTSQQALRSILLSLFDENLRANQLSALVYAEDALDDAHADLVWSLLMKLPPLLHRPAASSLVVLAGDSWVRPGRHCVGSPSLRWQLSEAGVTKRHTRQHDEGISRRLASHSKAESPLHVFMLGAGASAGYLPTGNEVRDIALGSATGMKVDSGTVREAAKKFFARLRVEGRLIAGEEDSGPELFADRLTLERVLREEQHEQRTQFSKTLRWFADKHSVVMAAIDDDRTSGRLATDPVARLLNLQRRLVLLTVNFDRVIEAKGGSSVRSFVTEDELSKLPGYLDEYALKGGPVPLVKVHGDIDQHETIVANVQSTLAGLSEPMNLALKAVKDRLAGQAIKPLTYVGYSMRDLDLADFWGDHVFATTVIENWVAPFPDPAVLTFINDKRAARWGRELDPHTVDGSFITLTGGDFFEIFGAEAETKW